MKTVDVLLNSIEKVREFVGTVSKFDCDLDFVSGRYVIDAKSILGIFSLNLSSKLSLNIHAGGNQLDSVMNAIQPYLAC